jgi:hypothetical protein
MPQQQSNNIFAISNKLQVLLYSLYSLPTGNKGLLYFSQDVPYFSTHISFNNNSIPYYFFNTQPTTKLKIWSS